MLDFCESYEAQCACPKFFETQCSLAMRTLKLMVAQCLFGLRLSGKQYVVTDDYFQTVA